MLVGILALAIVAGGCAKKSAVDDPQAARPPGPAEEAALEAKGPIPETEESAEVSAEAPGTIPEGVIAAWDLEAEESNPDLPTPGEEVTESPYDDLAEIIEQRERVFAQGAAAGFEFGGAHG